MVLLIILKLLGLKNRHLDLIAIALISISWGYQSDKLFSSKNYLISTELLVGRKLSASIKPRIIALIALVSYLCIGIISQSVRFFANLRIP